MATKKSEPTLAPTDEYPERPYEEAKADPKDIEAAENRSTVDQITDYHDEHPTLFDFSEETVAEKKSGTKNKGT